MNLRDKWNIALMEFKNSLNLVRWLPHEVVYEIQNTLVHMLIIIRTSGSDNRRKEWKRALAHLRRAHLDLLKICLFKIHERLQSNKKNPNDCSTYLQFQKDFSQCRLKELQTLGDWEVYEFYRNIIKQYGLTGGAQVYPQPEAPITSFNKNYPQIENYANLLWEWSQLETIQTSFLGQKLYNTSFRMVEAYLKADDFSKVLKNLIITLRANIVILAVNEDCDNSLKSKPPLEIMKAFLDNMDKLRSKEILSPSAINQLYNDLSNQVDKIFPFVLKWLGVSFVPLDFKN